MKTLMQTLFFFLLATQIGFAQWVQVGLQNYSVKDIAARDSIIFAVSSDSCYDTYHGSTCKGKLFRSVDNGSSWMTIVDSNAVDVAISQSGKVFFIKDWSEWWWGDSLYSSSDNGDTWICVNIMEQLIDLISEGGPENITVSPDGNVFCGIHFPGWGLGDALAKSTDDGLIWTTPGTGVISGRFYDFRNQFVITAGEFRCISTCPWWWDIYLSSDYGNNWSYLGGPASDHLSALGLFSNGNIIIGGMVDSLKVLHMSADNCSSWTQIGTINLQVGISFSLGSSEGILLGTDDGVFLFSDEGDSLGSRNEGLVFDNILALTIDNTGYVYAGTEVTTMLGSGGIWRRPLFEIIPVELTSFTAATGSHEVILNWSTATELNNLGFEIQRSIDKNEFLTIGFVKGHGTTTEVHNYGYTDRDLKNGKYYYRLKQVDFDGNFEFSDAVEIEMNVFSSYLLEQNYPNPFNPVTTIGFGIQEKSNVRISILNIIGEEVAVILNEEREAGYNTIEFNASKLPSGVYFYQLKAGNYMDTKKMILIK